MTRRRLGRDRGAKPSASYWFVALEHAMSERDDDGAREARSELARLGVAVVVDTDSPLRRRGDAPRMDDPTFVRPRIAHVCAIKAGWLHGDGEAIYVPPVWVEQVVRAFESAGLGTPAIFPREGGEVGLEWFDGREVTIDFGWLENPPTAPEGKEAL